MWESTNSSLPSVLIVESVNGDVFIVEDKKSESQVDRILKTERSTPKKNMKSIKIETRESSPVNYAAQEIKNEEEEIIEEYLDEYFESEELEKTPFVDSSDWPSTVTFSIREMKTELKEETDRYAIPDAILDHQYMIPQPTFNGNYTSDEFDEPSDDETLVKTKSKIDKTNKGRPRKHKLRQLTGKTACKYCDTVFSTKESLKMHICEYLQCDPKNFICRICKKELSKKTFSNHLHETLDCQYCGKQFVNPRNMKAHIMKVHKDEKFIPPKSPKWELFEGFENRDEVVEPVLDETTGLMVTKKPPRKKYPRKTGRFECDLCGRLFTTLRSLQIHMDLHTNSHRFICQTCGEKYTTHTGILKHACLNKKRKRPEVDFRIFDVRHCKYCGLAFETLEANKAHICEYQFASDPKMFRCRFCLMEMSKNSYNKHMNRHVEPSKEWICGFCNKKLSDEVGLNIHLTTHTGDKPFKCPYEECGQSFINKQLMVRHTRFHGLEIPVYICKICSKEVASKYHLKTHMKIHTDTFECQLCKTECESKDLLKTHYQESHMPFNCSYCDKSFILPRYLKMHEKLHNPSKPRPFKCEFCMAPKSFTKLVLLLNHVFKSHNDQFEEWKKNNPEIFK